MAGLVTIVIACRPTGPTPIELTVPTAIQYTPEPAMPTLPMETPPTQPPSSTEEPTSPSTEAATTMPEPTSVQVVAQAGWNVLPLVPGGRVLTPTAGRDAVLWVAPAGPGLGLSLYHLRTGKTQGLAEPSTAGGCVCRGYVRGDWVVMVETEPGATWWEVSVHNLVTGDRTVVGRTDDPATLSAMRPGEFAINVDGVVVWKDVTTRADGSVAETLRRFNLADGKTSDVITVRSPVRIEHLGVYGDWVVWDQATEDEAGTRGDVFAYDLRSDSLFPIGETGRAWEPAIWGTTVVWKHADGPFADGDVFLFDLAKGQGRLLTEGATVSQVGAGDGFVVWSSSTEGIIIRRDLATGTEEVIGRGAIGWLEAGANTVAWLLDGDPDTLHIAWRR